MSGKPKFNFPLFLRTAEKLRAKGYEVVNPAELDEPEHREQAMLSKHGDWSDLRGQSWDECLARDVQLIASDKVEGVICLPGWYRSKGATLEVTVATCLNKPVYEIDNVYSNGIVYGRILINPNKLQIRDTGRMGCV